LGKDQRDVHERKSRKNHEVARTILQSRGPSDGLVGLSRRAPRTPYATVLDNQAGGECVKKKEGKVNQREKNQVVKNS